MDIQPKQCEESGCKYAASFGEMQDKRARFCARHKLLGMLNIHEMVRVFSFLLRFVFVLLFIYSWQKLYL